MQTLQLPQNRYATIDDDDYEELSKYKWWLDGKGYVQTKVKRKNITLHQMILGKRKGFEIDHINHDKLDNRKTNLRHCTVSQNQMNRKVKGYCYNKVAKKFQAYIQVYGKVVSLGYFIKKEDAIVARKQGEQKYFKEYAYKE